MSYDFRVGQRYKFETWAPSILGTEFGAVYVRNTMTYEDAIAEEEVNVLNAQILPIMQNNPAVTQLPTDYTKLIYIKIDTAAGKRRILAVDWIRPDSIERISSMNVTVDIANVNPSDISVINQMLVQNGFPNYRIETRTVG